MSMRFIAMGLLLGALAGCAVSPRETVNDSNKTPADAARPAEIDVRGTVRWSDLEGGFWAIVGDDGKTYDPRDGVPEGFRQDGLRVRLRAREVKDAVSIRMVGPIVEIVELTRL
jgi:hypothetical protein